MAVKVAAKLAGTYDLDPIPRDGDEFDRLRVEIWHDPATGKFRGRVMLWREFVMREAPEGFKFHWPAENLVLSPDERFDVGMLDADTEDAALAQAVGVIEGVYSL